MYQDISNASDHNILEKELSKLKSQVSTIIARIKKAFESSKDSFSMSRDQRDILRKFLFIIKYRGPGFHQRFHGDTSGRYVKDDADQLEKYMIENGYHNPVDVWFRSIKTILDLRFDLQGNWQKELLAKIYPKEDTNECIKISRRNLFELSRSRHINPDTAKSILEDLPLRKPRNSYSQVLPQGIQLLPGKDGTRRSYHRFTFPFFKISTDQMHKINCILLENAHLTSVIRFSSRLSLKESLEHYLQLPADCGYKVVRRPNNDRKLVYLKKLELIARSLGSAVMMSYKEVLGADEIEELRQESLRQLQKALLENLPERPTEFMQLYQKLGM
ncbi:hypothetical protein IG631_23929 [Alternaria alternata]|nr:hypothetical protein IG631_23929 [Alternaria alternata]